MTPTREQRAMMAADLWTRAARRVLDGEPEMAMRIADRATMILSDHEAAVIHYRNGLHIAGTSNDDAQAACEAIARGERPATSLPGMVEKAMGKAARGCNAEKMRAYEHVLYLLGVKS